MERYILAIESSCDETAVALIDLNGNIFREITKTQIDLHKIYGGVVPEIASRSHLSEIRLVLSEMLAEDITTKQIIAVAATGGPGLMGGLMVGINVAKGISIALNIPFIAVNHLHGHALSPKIDNKSFDYPFLLLLISGGHCQTMAALAYDDYRIIGRTVDDSIGEAFDKVARMLGFDYPGGLHIQEAASSGNKHKYKLKIPMNNSSNPNFSFSGLKTAVLRIVQKIGTLTKEDKSDIAACFQYTATMTLERKMEIGIKIYNQINNSVIKRISVCGGVAANTEIREMLDRLCNKHGFDFFMPAVKHCTDNAAMIAIAALDSYRRGDFSQLDFEPQARWNM